MALTLEQANALLGSITTQEQLRDLINQLDIHSSGSITVLYSGDTANGVSNPQILQGMLHNGDAIRVIDTTEAAKFLNIPSNDPYRNKALLRSHYHVDVLLHGYDGDSIKQCCRMFDKARSSGVLSCFIKGVTPPHHRKGGEHAVSSILFIK
nr:RTX toxin [Xylella fastidiosa]